MLVSGYWILDTGCLMLDIGYWILDSGCWALVSLTSDLRPLGFVAGIPGGLDGWRNG